MKKVLEIKWEKLYGGGVVYARRYTRSPWSFFTLALGDLFSTRGGDYRCARISIQLNHNICSWAGVEVGRSIIILSPPHPLLN